MTWFFTVLHWVVCALLVFVVLLQRGKGAEIGAVFGGAGSNTLFGSRGAGNFLTKLTTGAAVVFMCTSFYLAYVALAAERSGVYDAEVTVPAAVPGAPAAAASSAGAGEGDFVEVMSEPAAEAAPADAATPEGSAAGSPAEPPAQ
jgi:preprotein translocase subunit SecG